MRFVLNRLLENRYKSLRFVMLAMIMFVIQPASVFAVAPNVASADQAPAGQVCPEGSYVIGFDSRSNIICSGSCGNGILDSGEACDDGNTAPGDGCSANCQSERIEAADPVQAREDDSPAVEPEALLSPAAEGLVISDIEPSSVVFGTSEVTIAVTGTGFNETSVIIFEGSHYKPVVDATGTRLEITIATEDLSIGPYALKISNGPGQEITRKRALVIY